VDIGFWGYFEVDDLAMISMSSGAVFKNGTKFNQGLSTVPAMTLNSASRK
jgi:hypothetical protein